MTDVRFVVVGGGVMGLATAWTLKREGHDVLLLEQFEAGHALGSSHGASRVYRTFYDRVEYARMALDALPMWRELEQESGTQLLEIVGSIETLEGSEGDRRTLDALGISYEIVSEADAAVRFPDVHLPGDVLYQADTGVLAADATTAAYRELLGDTARCGARALAVREDGDGVVVETEGGSVTASVAILCCGAYAPELLAVLGITVPMIPTQEQIGYFRHRTGELPPAPVINDLSESNHYGLPTSLLGLYKFAEHGTGPRVDMRDRDPSPDHATTERLARAAKTFLPGFDPEPVGVETCVYENTPDRDFVIDRRGQVVVGTGFSGHGFKFAPLVGRVLADLALDREPKIARDLFSLDRPALRADASELARPR
jgi:sarcosine oxidase